MGTLINRVVLTVSLALVLAGTTPPTYGATSKPTSSPTSKPTSKTVPTPTAKTTSKTSPLPKTSVAPTKKPAVKTVIKPKKKIVYKKRNVKITPSKSPAWPPKSFEGWKSVDDVYWKTSISQKEQNGILSDLRQKTFFSEQMKDKTCTKFACGVIALAATDGCRWWQIDSVLSRPTSATDPTPIVIGSIRTLLSSTKARERATVWLVSTESLKFSDDTFTKVTDIYCNHMPSTEKLNTNTYTSVSAQ
ncbi:unannotated protein [freshwater metagenome]|uniref:Unannotated protein n=1 Tax=freshwater metagenome TaxID=449393 RepID=A0A6J6FHD4_9ZZZZ|nr:hypothetical protein [Actinomycetota bacterium]MSW68163.1 hypothetical protein [Actinomycetota bacterium]MSY03535.1 hypothetical protein [Actinomycetota bacterium]MSY39786.1 hypothetical protein [Actinomycetota bacterium]MSZ85957.1 hypothetical protein [Actinomycetota bacterium]